MTGTHNINTSGGTYHEENRNIKIGSGDYIENVGRDYIKYASEDRQSLADAAAEIQKLLKQLEQTNPTATEEQQQAYVEATIASTLKKRAIRALKEGWKEIVREIFDNPYVNVGMAILEGWKEAK